MKRIEKKRNTKTIKGWKTFAIQTEKGSEGQG